VTALVIKYDSDGAARIEVEDVADSNGRAAAALPFVPPLPDAIQRRVQRLLERNATGALSADERGELEAYVEAGLDAAARILESKS
jgi:hypothetical protein